MLKRNDISGLSTSVKLRVGSFLTPRTTGCFITFLSPFARPQPPHPYPHCLHPSVLSFLPFSLLRSLCSAQVRLHQESVWNKGGLFECVKERREGEMVTRGEYSCPTSLSLCLKSFFVSPPPVLLSLSFSFSLSGDTLLELCENQSLNLSYPVTLPLCFSTLSLLLSFNFIFPIHFLI